MQLQRQLEQFRSSHAHRARIPEALWRAAVELCVWVTSPAGTVVTF
ncbi:MAG: hypothetical protein ABSD59_21625 [Terracidiphilus sp.]